MTTTWVLNGRTWGYRQSDVPGTPYYLMGSQVFSTWHLLMQDIAAAGQQMETAAGAIESLIDVLPDALAGLVPALEGGAGKYLRLDPAGHVFELAALDAASLTGQVPVARMGTGTAGAGTVLRGDGTWGATLGDIQVGNLQVLGDLHVSGATVTVDAETVQVSDNVLVLNHGEVGPGVTAGAAGIQVDRGSAPAYTFRFEESRQVFAIGVDGDTQAVATREDAPLDGGFARWNAASQRYDAVSPEDVLAAATQTGTFVPVLTGTGGGAYNMESGSSGSYVKLGKLVTCHIANVNWNGGGPYVGSLIVTGLPFVARPFTRSSGVIAFADGLSPAGGGINAWTVSTVGGSDYLLIMNMLAGGGYSSAPVVASTGLLYAVTISYLTDE